MKVLIVDDDTEQLERFIAIAQKIRPLWEFKGLCNSSLAVGWILNDSYDGVVCDVSMPYRSGVDIVYQLHHRAFTVPLLLHSNSSVRWQDRVQFAQKGQQRFMLAELAKEFDFVTFHLKQTHIEETRAYFESFFKTLDQK